MKTIIHLNESHRWSMVESNIKNIHASSSSIEIAVVINGDAVTLFTKQDLSLPFPATFYICQNSLNQRQIPLSHLHPEVIVVKSGVVKIIELQEEGYHYLKP